MKRLTIVLFIILISTSVIAKPDTKFSGLIQLNRFTGYPWRNLIFKDGHVVYGELNYGKIGLGFFQYSIWQDKKWNKIANDEFDYILLFKHATKQAEITLMFSYYNLPSINKWHYSEEVGFIISLIKIPLRPTIQYYYDMKEFNSGYYSLLVSYQLPREIQASAEFGYNEGQWLEHQKSLCGVNWSLSKSFKLYTLEPQLTFFDLLTEDDNNYGVVVSLSQSF